MRKRWLVLVAVVTALVLVAGTIAGLKLYSGWGSAPAASAGHPVAVHGVKGRTVEVPMMRPYHQPRVSWPAAGSATVSLTAGSSRAGDLPVWVGRSSSVGASRVQVSVASHAVATALGVHGVVLTVTRADGGATAGQVHVSVDYSAFAHAYGAGYASRMRLVELPACALTTPQAATCRTQTPVSAGSADSVRASRVAADVTVPGARTTAVGSRTGPMLTVARSSLASTVVLAATAAASGSGGDYAVPSLSENSGWVQGGSSGAYSYSYPIQVPPVPGGLQPKVSLDYNSQSVDGLTSATNNEASWIGDGWDYAPGYIEEDYVPCSTELSWSGINTGDLCAATKGDYRTLSLNGTKTTLVGNSSSGYHAEADGGAKFELLTLSGTSQTYWKMTEPDGTSYYFGLDQLPGYAAGNALTNSAWTVPVWNLRTYQTQVWRWNLDYVTDVHGDAVAYFYNAQTNYYAEGNGTTGTGQYTQGGALAKIEYGLRAGSVYGVTPAAQVSFTTSSSRQDAPDDLACTSGAACSVTAPTFWTDYALTGINTQTLVGSSLQNVDSWALSGTYPATGDSTTSPSLWLSSITRTAQDGSTSITLPPTSFAGTAMPNRAQTAADTTAGYSLITRYRLTAVTNITGGVTSIGYAPEDSACAAGTFMAPDSNTTTCYPSYWLPSGSSTAVEDWFNVYPVTKTTVTDTTGGDPPVVTSYSRTGPAWHYDDDTVTRSVTQTWDQWRGYQSVTTENGTAPDPVTEQTDTYFQGMDGDRTSGLTTKSVHLTSSHGGVVTDNDPFAGMVFESIVYNGAGTGTEVSDTIHGNDISTLTGSDSSLGLSSYLTEDGGSTTYTTLAGGGTRVSTVAYTYDSYGRVTQEIDVPDTSDTAQTTCTLTTYAGDPNTAWVLTYPSEVKILATGSPTTCSMKASSQLVSDTTYAYGSAWDVTKTQKATTAGVLANTYTTVQMATYDEYGRPLTIADADNRTTTTTYTPATGAEPTSVQVTDPAGLGTTTTYDPARDVPLTVTDPADHLTAATYDALGRITAKWTPGNATSGPPVEKYSYTVSDTAPSVVTKQTEQPGGGYRIAQAIADSLGNIRENQIQTASGGSDVTDVSYNSDGLKALSSDPYYTSSPPSGTLVAAASSTVPSQTGYIYDGAGRVIKEIAYKLGTETWETDTSYGGNYTTVVPPSGGTSKTTFSDGRGLTTAIYQYHAGATASPSDASSDYDKTSYTYTPAGQLATVTDAAGNTWSWTYDLLGNQVSQTDPDAGKSTATYDAAGQTITVTDAREKTISYAYDADGRKTAEYDTTGGALESTSDQLASWTYDTLAKGALTSSTAYHGGASYTVAVTGYNSYGLPSGSQTIIPSAQGGLAGAYAQTYAYAPSGQMTSYTDSAAGGLPAETVTTGYNSVGEATSLTGTSSYVDSLSYTNLGQPLQYTMGTSSEPAYITDSWDSQTSLLTEQNTQTGTAQTSIDDLHYNYDNAGNVTSEADTQSGASAATDVQCFSYDYLGRLVQAWAQGNTGCATTPSASAEGGAAPYWNSYTYDTTGNLTGITSTTSTGAVTATANTYPAAGATRPHAVTAAKVTTSSGTASTSYTYDAAGNLNTVTGTSQTQALTWDATGRLSQDTVTPSGGTAQNTAYTYDADGHLLLAADPGTTTLYLPDEELSLNTSTGIVTGTRYYSLGGTIAATRTGASSVAYLAGDFQGTDSVAIDSATLNVTRRYFDPYGNPRGTAPATFPVGQKGFVGGIADTATSLTNLGAREYQPGTGSFISPDPLMSPYEPQDLNPYAYAKGNPSTLSDPSGQCTPGQDGCPGTYYDPKTGCRGSSEQMLNQCIADHTPKKQPTNGQNRGTPSSPITKISAHIYAVSGSQDCAQLQADWQWAVNRYGKPKNANQEFNDWWHACNNGPYRCTGAMGSDFREGMTPNYNVEIGWNDGIKMLVGGGTVIGVFVPGVRSYSSSLGRALIKMGYQPPDSSYQAHHIIPQKDPNAKEAKQLLEQYGKEFKIGINSGENGVWLPRSPKTVNWFNDVFHSQTFGPKYARWVVRQLSDSGSLQDVLKTLEGIRDTLLSGDTPWADGPGDGSGDGAGVGGE